LSLKRFANRGVFDRQFLFCIAVVLACGGTVYILHPNAEHAIQGYGSCIQNQQAGLFPIKQSLKSEWLVVHFCERAIRLQGQLDLASSLVGLLLQHQPRFCLKSLRK
jgi:hypothetical protein